MLHDPRFDAENDLTSGTEAPIPDVHLLTRFNYIDTKNYPVREMARAKEGSSVAF